MELRRASTFLGCGCAVAIAVLLATVVSLTWTTYRSGKELARLARDPQAAAARTRQVVDFGELPAGYRPFGALSVPLLLDVAFFLSPVDEPAAAGATAGGTATGEEPLRVDQGFLYVRLRDWLGRGDELGVALGDDGADAAPIHQEGLDFSPREVVARGELASGGAAVRWLARRGDVSIDPGGFGGGEGRVLVDDEELVEVESAGDAEDDGAAAGSPDPVPGVLTLLTFDCGDDGWQRLGVWFAPDPAPDRPVADVDWGGGPADPAAIADFLARFEICG